MPLNSSTQDAYREGVRSSKLTSRRQALTRAGKKEGWEEEWLKGKSGAADY